MAANSSNDASPRLGIALAPSKQTPIEEIVRLAQLAERLGYASIWIPETWGVDAVSVLAILSRETSTIKLASGVFNVYSRSAALIAQTAATLQEFSGGRFILGLGSSGPIVVENWHGIPFTRPLQRTREYVAVIRMALAGERVNYAGSLFQLRDFRLLNPPDAPVPIYIAALGPRNVEMTGEVADGWLPIFAAPGHLGEAMEHLQAGARLAGRDAADIDVAAYVPAVLSGRSANLLRQHLAYYVGGMGTFYYEFVSGLGFESEAQRIRELWLAGDRLSAGREVSDDLLAACTLYDDAVGARARLEEYRRDGVRLPVLTPPRGCSVDEIAATIEGLAPRPTPEPERSELRPVL